MQASILDLRSKSKNKFELIETLNNIEKELIEEGGSFIGRGIQRAMTAMLMALFDDATGELSGMIAALPLLYKNVFELSLANRKVRKELAKPVEKRNKKLLKKLRKKLISDVSDIVNAVVLALPIPVIDTAALSIFNLIDQLIVGDSSVSVVESLNSFEQSSPEMARVLKIIAYPLGGRVIYNALVNISKINNEITIIDDAIKQIEMERNTPDETYASFFTDPGDDSDIVQEDFAVKRWQVLSGIN